MGLPVINQGFTVHIGPKIVGKTAKLRLNFHKAASIGNSAINL